MADNKNDIEKMILADKDRLVQAWRLRDDEIQKFRRVINLTRPDPEPKDVKWWMSNEPKVFFDTARALVSIYGPKFRLPIPINYDPIEKERMNKAERFCIGIYRTLDKRSAKLGRTTWLYDFADYVLSGWYAIFAICQRSDEGVEFKADIWNPVQVYPEWDETGLSKCVRAYEIDETQSEKMALDFMSKGLEFEYKRPDKGQPYNVVNWWRRDGKKVFNAILLNGKMVKPPTLQRNLRTIPIHVGAIGSPDRTTASWQKRYGESIIASNFEVYDRINEIISLRAEITDQTAFPNLVGKSRTGQPVVKGEDVHGHGSVLNLKLEETIEILKHAATPQDADILAQFFNLQAQKGSLPNVVYGGINVELSGFAISQLMAAIKYKLGPYINAMQFVIGDVMSDLLYQYRTGSYGDITLSTENPYDLKRGMSYIEEFSREDVPERIYVEVTIPITSQFDKTQAILNSVQALQAGLLSRETLWENELNVDDAEQEKQRIVEDQVSNDPFVRQLEIIMRMRDRAQVYEDNGLVTEAQALRTYIATLETNLGIIPGAATPKAQPGIPPEQRPPEASGESPDMINAMVGKPPPSPNRPRREPILVTPEGQPLV